VAERRRIVAVAIVLTLGVGGLFAYFYAREHDAPTGLTLYGNVDIREVELAFRVGGRLESLFVDEGDAIVAGQALGRIDAQPYREALAVAVARVEQARANLAKLERGLRPAEVQQARAVVREAEASFENARLELERQEGLLPRRATTQRDVDAARANRDRTAATLAAARQGLLLAEEGFRAEDIAVAKAELAAVDAQREQLATALADTELAAPADGVVLARVREPGSMLAQGQPVLTLSLRDPIYVRAYVREPDLGHVRPGARAYVTTDSSPKRYEGRVGFVSPRAEFTPKSVETASLRTDLVYRVRIVVENADDGLRQGMPVTVSIPIGKPFGAPEP
jgi:HlyD family secretion protein